MKNKATGILVSGIITLLCNIAHAQYRPKQLDTLIFHLQKKGVDTMLIYMQGAVWLKPIKPGQPTCSCTKTLIYSVILIYKDRGRFYKLDYTCCKETDTTKLQSSVSITYSLLQKQALIMPKNYFSKHKSFPPPIPTDYPWENVELIVAKKHYDFELDSYKSTDGYKIWKQYPWIDRQIKLIKLIRQDLRLTDSD